MSKQVPQEVYGLKGGMKDFVMHGEEHKKRAKAHHDKFCER